MKLTHRISLLLLGIVLLLALPVMAQEDTILDIASGSTDFEILTAALEATGMDSDLSGEGAFTVFAPTDAAFSRAFEELGIDDDAALADVDLIEAILEYHVIDGTLLSGDLADGAYTTLGGGTVQINNVDGTVMVNDATVTQADLLASNGVVHVIDRVLLPAGTRLRFSSQEVTEVAGAYVRVVHLADDAPTVDLYVNGEKVASAINYGRASQWVGIDDGANEIAVVPAGNSVEEAFSTQELEVGEDAWTNIVVVGADADDTLTTAVAVENVGGELTGGFANALFFNGITAPPAPYGPVIDLYADGQRLVEALRFPGVRGADGAFERTLPEGLYDFAVTLQAAPNVVLASLPDIPVTEGYSYFIAYAGTADNAYSFVLETIHEAE